MGCGACATVCPSGAMSYAYPSVPDLGLKAPHAPLDLREGRRSRCLHPAPRGGWTRRDREPRAARPRASGSRHPVRGAPRCLSRDSTSGFGAVAHGASQVAVLASGAEAPQYREALGSADAHRRYDHARRWATRASISGWSTAPIRRRWMRRCGRGRRALRPRRRHLRVHRRQAHDLRRWRSITLRDTRRCRSGRSRSRWAPRFGAIVVDRDACTMCLACVGSCPEGAILDKQEAPELSSSNRNACSAASARRRARRTPSRSRRGYRWLPEARQPRVINRSRGRQLHQLRQAARHGKDGHGMLAKLPGTRCSRRPARSTGCGCAPTAAWWIS
jgi:ferredoxin